MAVSVGRGDKGDAWRRVTKDINAQNFAIVAGERLQFQFIGVVGSGVKSDSAIDDVRLHKTRCDQLCPEHQFTCDAATRSCIPHAEVTIMIMSHIMNHIILFT